ncbi:winged helix-turn-helix domain-containing protein [Marinobacter hydrocarbonoclasticus]|nr:winged helix-turn-helix domain-containing protein [Marinobacter nauticus]
MNYRFDRFALDLTHQRLTCDQQLLSSDPRLIRLLQLLIEAAPEPVDSDTLLRELWPDTQVSHWSISRLISDARKLFKGAGADFTVIQTLHGRGYRLASDLVQRLESDLPSPPPPPVSPPDESSKSPTSLNLLPWPVRLLLLSQIILASILAWQLLRPAEPPLRLGEPPNPAGRILWVDDHPENNLMERRVLQQQRIAVYTTTSSHEAMLLLDLYQYDLIISDMGRAGESLAGLNLVASLREQGDHTPYLLYTIMVSDNMRVQADAHGAQGVAETSTALFHLIADRIPLDVDRAQQDRESLSF